MKNIQGYSFKTASPVSSNRLNNRTVEVTKNSRLLLSKNKNKIKELYNNPNSELFVKQPNRNNNRGVEKKSNNITLHGIPVNAYQNPKLNRSNSNLNRQLNLLEKNMNAQPKTPVSHRNTHNARYAKISIEYEKKKAKKKKKEAQKNLYRKQEHFKLTKKKECANAQKKVENNLFPGLKAAQEKVNASNLKLNQINIQIKNASKNRSRSRLETGDYKGISGSFLKMKNKYRTRANTTPKTNTKNGVPKKSMMQKMKFW